MKGFFSGETLEEQKDKTGCEACGLHRDCKSPKMPVHGKGKKGILVIGEAPGLEEDRMGIPFIGQSGQVLRRYLLKHEIDLDEDCFVTNSCICRPTGNKKPSKKELKCCKKNVEKAIEKCKPTFIWLIGGTAVESFYMDRFSDLSITRWRGLCIPDRKTNAWVLPMYHPSFIMRNENDRNLETIYRMDIKNAVRKLRRDRPVFEDFESQVTTTTRPKFVVKHLETIIKTKPVIFFDYETSALKPFGGLHKIWCIAVAYEDTTISFPLDYPFLEEDDYKQIRELWIRILLDPRIKKVGHSKKFEDLWSRIIFKIDKVEGWINCTMNTAHIIDCRKKYSGLKFQSYIHFGVEGYDKEIKPFLSVKEGSKLNTVDQFPLKDLLMYNALDAKLTQRLYYTQQEILSRSSNSDLKMATDFFNEGLTALSDATINGICVDELYYKEQSASLDEKIEELTTKILNSPEAKKFKEVTGETLKIKNKDISTKDLRKLFTTVLGFQIDKQTETGLDSMDREILNSLGDKSEIAKLILERRKLMKINGTYLSMFLTNTESDGKLHPFFELHTTQTYRSCIAKGTKVLTIDRNFRDGIPIEEIKKGDLVYCYNDDMKLTIGKVLWSGKTGTKNVIRLYWKKKGSNKKGFLDLTPEHKIRLHDGRYIKAEDVLKDNRTEEQKERRYPKCSVASCSRFKKDKMTNVGIKEGRQEHRIIYEYFSGEKLKEDEIIHHLNRNHFDNRFDNLKKTTKSEHAKIHYKKSLCSRKAKKNSIKALKKRWKEGKVLVRRGEEHPSSLNLSREDCILLLVKHKGKAKNFKKEMDFTTFKKYLRKYSIDHNDIRIRYDGNGNYISRWRLKKLDRKYSRGNLPKILKLGAKKIKKLYTIYGISTERKWANQFGTFIPNNHFFYKIEKIEKPVDVYNLEVEKFHNFIANEICVKNSATNPSIQTIPTRDEEAKAYTRKGIVPSLGNKLLTVDFSSQEVRGIACYTKDPVLVKYIKDPTSDMHADTAKEVFLLNNKQITKMLRFYAKNQFVFPEFYGSYYVSCARNIWELCLDLETGEKIKVRDHLKNKGIKTYFDFESHLKEVEKKFWDRFPKVKEWQFQEIENYKKKGYVESKFGFRRSGYLSNNMIINHPIQSACFHLLLWSMIRINKISKRKWKTRIIAEIHDSIMFDLYPPEQEEVLLTCRKIMIDDTAKEFPWLIVPLDVEFAITEINGNLYTEKKIGAMQ